MNIEVVLFVIMPVKLLFFFLDFIASNDLLEVDYTSLDFTWYNNQSGLEHRWARLDRCLVNSAWTVNFDAYVINHLPRQFSDHAPLLLKASPHSLRKIKVFRFDNYWLDCLDCHAIVRDAWNFQPHSNPLHVFSNLVARTKNKIIL